MASRTSSSSTTLLTMLNALKKGSTMTPQPTRSSCRSCTCIRRRSDRSTLYSRNCLLFLRTTRTCLVNSQTSCSDCEIGKYQGQETATEWVCKPCGLGKIATSASASLCSNCEVGRFQDFTTAASHTCKICSIGMYSASATTTEGCVVCPAGFIQKIPGPEFYGCTKCAPGKINDDTGTGKSVNCVSFWFFLLSFFPMLDNLI